MELEVKQWSTSKLAHYPNNAREHSDAQVDQIAKSIKEFGFVNPILVDAKGVLIAGHGRLAAALKMKMKKVPVIKLGHLTENQAKALRIADNQLALNASWNPDMLRLELTDLKLEQYDLTLLGFERHQLDWFTSAGMVGDPSGEWSGMPAFNQEEKQAFRSINVHFLRQEDIDAFSRLVNQKITDKTRFLWFPPVPEESYVDKKYGQAAE